jgi:hypothetical protein
MNPLQKLEFLVVPNQPKPQEMQYSHDNSITKEIIILLNSKMTLLQNAAYASFYTFYLKLQVSKLLAYI